MENLRAILTRPGNIDFATGAVPRPGPGEAVVRVAFAGICGTDLALWSGSYPVDLPRVIGHEYSGHVIELAADAPAELNGAPVTGEINFSCVARRRFDPCIHCWEGMPEHCGCRTVLGIHGADGCFQQYLTVPWRTLHRLPENVTLESGTFVEPLAAALQTFELNREAENVAILGCGRLGSLIIQVAARQGLRVMAIVRNEKRAALARRMGASDIIPAGAGAALRVKEITLGLGADLVVEATGDETAVSEALNMVRPRGTITLKSTTGRPLKDLDTTRLVVDEIRLTGTRCGPFDKAVSFLAEDASFLQGLVEKVVPLKELPAALNQASAYHKLLIDCRN